MNKQISIWQQPETINWSQILCNSYQKLLNKKLIDCDDNPAKISEALFNAPFVVVSHGTQTDPIFNYGNQAALKLWSISWEEITKMPSRLSAEPVNRATRKAMLEQAAVQGYIDNYQGVRITSTGKKFLIKQAVIWNLTDHSGNKCGQAATFSDWIWL